MISFYGLNGTYGKYGTQTDSDLMVNFNVLIQSKDTDQDDYILTAGWDEKMERFQVFVLIGIAGWEHIGFLEGDADVVLDVTLMSEVIEALDATRNVLRPLYLMLPGVEVTPPPKED